MFSGMSLVRFLGMWWLLFGMLFLAQLLMIFGLFGVGVLRRVYFGPILLLEDPLKLTVLPFLAEACYEFVAGVWEARAVVSRGSSRLYRACQGDEVDVHCAQHFVSSSLAPVLLFRTP